MALVLSTLMSLLTALVLAAGGAIAATLLACWVGLLALAGGVGLAGVAALALRLLEWLLRGPWVV